MEIGDEKMLHEFIPEIGSSGRIVGVIVEDVPFDEIAGYVCVGVFGEIERFDEVEYFVGVCKGENMGGIGSLCLDGLFAGEN